MLVCSSGGHLAQLMPLQPWWSRYRRTWVTFDKVDAISILRDEKVIWAHHPTTRNLYNLARNLSLAIRTIHKDRPDIVISSGAGVSFPFFLVAKVYRIPTCYVEVYDSIDNRTLSGRLCRPISDLFLVQWEEQLALYPGSKLIGHLL
jgi:UDP-N-acetylglucosamine:LPS N-acetylglucosamine transferase